MAIDDAGESPAGALEGATESAESGGREEQNTAETCATVGSYTWAEFLREHGYAEEARTLYERVGDAPGEDRWGEEEEGPARPSAEDWARTGLDPVEFLGFHPTAVEDVLAEAACPAVALDDSFEAFCDPATTPVRKDEYLWEHYKREYYYESDGARPRDADGEIERFDAAEALGFDPADVGDALSRLSDRASELAEVVDERTVDVDEDLDEDAFFSTATGAPTVVNRYDLEKAVPIAKKRHFQEVERYWVNEPFAFVIVFHSTKENEKKYYVVEPYLTDIESGLEEFLTGKLRTAIKYADEGGVADDDAHRRGVIEERTYELLDRYDLFSREGRPFANSLAERLGVDGSDDGVGGRLLRALGYAEPATDDGGLDGLAARPEPAVLAEDAQTLSAYQVEKLLYYLVRDFIGYERIDGIKHDINVEDISCDGYNSPVFVYHGEYEQIITNIYHDERELDDFVVKLAQRSGKGISKRRPQVDATLPDGSRAQLTLGREVSDHGTNYTIRQFKDVPFTPLDLINWRTFALDQMGFLWLCIENDKSLIFAGGTASGKTTSLNAVSLFIPSNTKIVSIEDTREVELPQRNWIASVTRPSFSDDDKGDIDEFDLLEAALRQRPDYIVMGEIRGEEGRTLFQVMSTGHTTYTTFHADSVGEVLKRFTTDPINVSKTMFTALDLVSIQTSTRVRGRKVRRNKSLTEINHYDAENDEINVQDIYQWQAERDEFLELGESNTLEEVKFDRGWTHEELERQLFERRVVLAYLIERGLNTYTQVAATFQAYINDPDTILGLMATDRLEASLEDLREMESVLIDIDPEKEEMVPRPDPPEDILAEARALLDRAEEELFAEYRGTDPGSVADALADLDVAADVDSGATGPPDAESVDGPALDEADDPALVAGTGDRELDSGAGGSELDGEDPSPLAPGEESTTAPGDGDDSDDVAPDDTSTIAPRDDVDPRDVDLFDAIDDWDEGGAGPTPTGDAPGDRAASVDRERGDPAESDPEAEGSTDDGFVPAVESSPTDIDAPEGGGTGGEDDATDSDDDIDEWGFGEVETADRTDGSDGPGEADDGNGSDDPGGADDGDETAGVAETDDSDGPDDPTAGAGGPNEGDP